MATVNKSKSKTYQQISTQQDIKDILNQPNFTFKNKKGEDKQRHGDGLTIKFFNNIDVNDKLINSDKNEISLSQTITKEVVTQIDNTEEKSTDNFTKYLYNSMTILDEKQKKLFNLKNQLKNQTNERKELWNSKIIKEKESFTNQKEIKANEEWIKYYINKLNGKINDDDSREIAIWENEKNKLEKEIKINKENINGKDKSPINPNFFFLNIREKGIKEKIKEKNSIILKIEQEINKIEKEIELNKTKKSNKINKLEKKIEELKNQKNKQNNWKEKVRFDKKILSIEKQINNIKNENSKKIEKIYEEILPINNKIYFITTFQHADNSIREQVLFFQELTNGNIEVIKQNKQYENINEYEKDITLIDYQNTNIKFQFSSIEEFLNEHEELKLKPTKKERKIAKIIKWTGIALLILLPPIISIIVPALIPTTLLTIVAIEKASLGIFVGFVTNFLYKKLTIKYQPIIKKTEEWESKKYNKTLKDKIKENIEKTISNLTSDKPKIGLQTQFKILKRELDNRKDKNPDELISNNTLNNNSNSLLKNLIIESENKNNFDSSIKNTVNHQEQQPSTSTGIYHSNSRL